jgi:hypothetical protein
MSYQRKLVIFAAYKNVSVCKPVKVEGMRQVPGKSGFRLNISPYTEPPARIAGWQLT